MLEQRADHHQDNKMIKISTTHLMWLADLSKLEDMSSKFWHIGATSNQGAAAVYILQNCSSVHFKLALVYIMLQSLAMVKINADGAYVAQTGLIARNQDMVCLTTWHVLFHCESAWRRVALRSSIVHWSMHQTLPDLAFFYSDSISISRF
jgi:hypothetical protein